jgi:DNA-binding CsgD family transcriptional regulator
VHHARHAGDVAALLRYGVPAAVEAAAQGAHREAVAHFRAIRPHIGRLGPERRAELLEQHAVEAYLAGGAEEGLAAMQAALYEREGLGDPARVGENHRWISRLEWWSGRGASARAAAAQAVEVLTPAGPSRELAMAYSTRSQLHMLAHELVDAVDWGDRARALADRVGDLETSIHASINVGAARILAGDPAGVAEVREAHVRAAAAGLADHATRALVVISAYQQRAWQYDAAAPVLDDALAYASANDLDGYVQYLLGLRAEIRLERCDWEAALADCDDALGRPFRGGVAVQSALIARGRILAARGSAEAMETLDIAARYASGTEEVQRIGPVAAARAEYFSLAGDLRRAAEEARRALVLARAKGQPHYTAELAYRLWRVTGENDEPATGSTPYHLLMRGDWEGAAAAWASLGGRYAQIDALAQGDAAAVTEALRALGALGAESAAERVRADLRRRGVTAVPRGPRRSTTRNAAGLTTRQLEVLALLADGLTNTDIAARLTLSPKTVEHHVSAVLDKLRVATRGQAIAAAHRLNLVP